MSVICNFAKLLEKKLKNRMNFYFNENNVLNDRQFGFRNLVGPNDALLQYSSFIYKTLDSNKKVLTCFLDVKKAFDSVDHTILIEELQKIGFRNEALNWFRNYLADRNQKVKINNVLSNNESIECSVPQGTVLGPILFNIYLNKLFKNTIGESFVYADDTAISYTGDIWNEVHEKAERDLQNIFSWFSSMALLKPKYEKDELYDIHIPIFI